VQRYLGRISGPLLDRIDLQIEIQPVPIGDLKDAPAGESSAEIRRRVILARNIQQLRYQEFPGIHCNAQMNSKMIARWATPDAEAMQILETTMTRFDMSARAYDRILKVSRTIADLDRARLLLSQSPQPTTVAATAVAANQQSPLPEITEADINTPVTALHMHEAVSYRNLDRASWGLKY
jgi:magnesium chelatase family protein